ncbi:hypothetical protein HK405_005700 [Cladochytrium tenue]|nr:hypothetical protein HK405_005700 [Cladochytrium tenue]
MRSSVTTLAYRLRRAARAALHRAAPRTFLPLYDRVSFSRASYAAARRAARRTDAAIDAAATAAAAAVATAATVAVLRAARSGDVGLWAAGVVAGVAAAADACRRNAFAVVAAVSGLLASAT